MIPSLLQWQETTQQMTPGEKYKVSGSHPEHFQTQCKKPWPASPPLSSSITHRTKTWSCRKPLAASPAQHQELPLVSYPEVLGPECGSLMKQHSLMSAAGKVQRDSQLSSCTPDRAVILVPIAQPSTGQSHSAVPTLLKNSCNTLWHMDKAH